jgi:serine/threonine protein phosphatase PrpC
MSDNDITAPLETETLQAGWAVKSNARPQCYASILMGAKTDLGRLRENNEDKFDYLEPDEPSVLATRGRVFAVADGMGGHSAGQIAAEISLNLFISSYYSGSSADVESALTRAVREANTYVLDVANTVAGRKGMGATLTAVVVRDDEVFVAQVGDSRCYLLRDGHFRQLTEDHSWVAEQVRSGAMSLEEAEASPFRNVITRSMGGMPDVEPDITTIRTQAGDRFLLCSDGLSGMVDDAEMAELLGQGSPTIAAWNLVQRANQQGGRDNITAMVLHVAEIIPWPEEDPAPPAEEPAAPDAANGRHPAADATAPESEENAQKAGVMGRLFGRRARAG